METITDKKNLTKKSKYSSMHTYLKKEMNDVVNDDVMSAVILKTSNDSHCHTEWYNMMASRRQWQIQSHWNH